MARSLLLVPCLLIGLACATPFPLDSLEEGMTTEAVRENFGEPEAIETPDVAGGQVSDWTYVDEEPMWLFILTPPFQLSIPICAAIPDTPWHCITIKSRPILLHFEAEKLVHWNVGAFKMTPSRSNYPGHDEIMHRAYGHPGHIHHGGC